MTLARPPVVSQSEWDAALAAMTEREEAVGAALHELAAARKRMPMVRVERDYGFEGPDGRRSLVELFDGRSQLILYRFFFEEGVNGWPDAGCPGCSSVADGIADLGSVHARDITFAMVSPAPQANLRALRRAHGLDRPALVHDLHRALLGRLRGRRVVRLQRLPPRRRRRVPHLLPPARARRPERRHHLEPGVPHALRQPGGGRGRARGVAAGAVVVLVPASRRVRRAAAVGPRPLPTTRPRSDPPALRLRNARPGPAQRPRPRRRAGPVGAGDRHGHLHEEGWGAAAASRGSSCRPTASPSPASCSARRRWPRTAAARCVRGRRVRARTVAATLADGSVVEADVYALRRAGA